MVKTKGGERYVSMAKVVDLDEHGMIVLRTLPETLFILCETCDCGRSANRNPSTSERLSFDFVLP